MELADGLVDCNTRIRSDAMGRITVDPLHGFGCEVVLANVSHEFALEVSHGGEYAAGDHVALNLREPQFHLVEPRGVSRGVMQMHVGMLVQKLVHARCLVRRQVVADDVGYECYSSLGLVRTADTACTGAAGGSVSVDLIV